MGVSFAVPPGVDALPLFVLASALAAAGVGTAAVVATGSRAVTRRDRALSARPR